MQSQAPMDWTAVRSRSRSRLNASPMDWTLKHEMLSPGKGATANRDALTRIEELCVQFWIAAAPTITRKPEAPVLKAAIDNIEQ